MNNKIYRAAFLASFFGLLVACTGENAWTDPGDDGTLTKTGVTISLKLSASSMGTASNQSVTITATVLDGNNSILANQPVVFSSDTGLIDQTETVTGTDGKIQASVSPGDNQSNRTITVTVTAPGTDGWASAKITLTGTIITISGAEGITINETTTLTVNAKDSNGDGINGVTLTKSSSPSAVLGTMLPTDAGVTQFSFDPTVAGLHTITVSGLGTSAKHYINVSNDFFFLTFPSLPAEIGACETVQATLIVGGLPASGSVSFTSSWGNFFYSDATCTTPFATYPAAGTLDATGVATVYFRGNQTGPVTIVAEASGNTVSQQINIVATTPAKLSFSASPTAINAGESTTLYTVVRDINDNLVSGVTVDFSKVIDGSLGTLNPISVVTDSAGRANSLFTAGTGTSTSDGVILKASVRNTTLSQDVTLTVGGQATGLTMGMATLVQSITNDTEYSWTGSVTVLDANNVGVPQTPVTVSVRPLSYDKGQRHWSYLSSSWVPVSYVVHGWILSPEGLQTLPCMNEDLNRNAILDKIAPDGEPDTNGMVHEDVNCNGALDQGSADLDGDGVVDFTWSEDLDGDGLEGDPDDVNGNCRQDEDYNLNGRLDPGGVLTVKTAEPSVTNADGVLTFSLVYKKDYGSWVDVLITATTTVAGTESSVSRVDILPVAANDVNKIGTAPPGLVSPLGYGYFCPVKW